MVTQAGERIDVIGAEHPGPRRPAATWAVVGGLLAALTVGAAAGVLATRDAPGPGPAAPAAADPVTLPMTGTVVLETFDVRQTVPAFGLSQDRDVIARGRMVLRLPAEELRGIVRLDYDASFRDGPNAPDVLHGWGTLTVSLEKTSCTGTFGWSFLRAPAASGGALQLRCDDGAVLGAQMVRSAEEVPGLAADLRAGWYRAG